MKSKENEIRLLYGKLLAPLRVGKPAAVLHTGGLTHTTPVRVIRRLSKTNVVFETGNTVYCVAPYLHPAIFTQPAGAAA